MNSVKSNWAMWIHHSWGNLMNTVMKTAIDTTASADSRAGFQRVRTAS